MAEPTQHADEVRRVNDRFADAVLALKAAEIEHHKAQAEFQAAKDEYIRYYALNRQTTRIDGSGCG